MRVSVVITIWIILPSFISAMASISTDVIEAVCVPYVYLSGYMEIPILFVTFLLPLALMIFCYSRIVHALRTKVTQHIFTIQHLFCIFSTTSSVTALVNEQTKCCQKKIEVKVKSPTVNSSLSQSSVTDAGSGRCPYPFSSLEPAVSSNTT